MGKFKPYIVSILIALPFLAVEMSPLGGNWTISLIIWVIFIILLGIYHRKFVMRVRFRSPIFFIRQGATITQTQAIPHWLEQVLEDDKTRLGSRVYWREFNWHWEGLKNTDSYMEFTVRLINATCFPILVVGVEGRLQIMGQVCSRPCEKEGKTRIPHGESSGIRIKQWLSPEMVNLMRLTDLSDSINVDLKSCVLIIKPEVPSQEIEPAHIAIGISFNLSLPEDVL